MMHYDNCYIEKDEVGSFCNIGTKRDHARFLQGKEYLTSMVILIKCDCILASRTGESVGVQMMSDGWYYEKFYDLRRYPDN